MGIPAPILVPIGICTAPASAPAAKPINAPDEIQRAEARVPDHRSENATVKPPRNVPRVEEAIRSGSQAGVPDGNSPVMMRVTAQENNPDIPPTSDMK
jgi:hypothetical protein